MTRGQKVSMHTFNRGDKVMVEGHGSYITDADGTSYLDFVSGIAVNALGHTADMMVETIQQQSQTLIHTSNLYWNTSVIEASEKLVKASGLDKVFFSNSGAEANEAAIKLARKWGRENKGEQAIDIVTIKQSFHGRTIATLSATGQKSMHVDFGPNVQGFSYAELNNIADLQEKITANTCAIMLEVIQGEGGIHAVSDEFVAAIKAIREDKNVLVIIDEIQTGIGRTGTMFAFQQFGIEPDIMTLAKGLGGGIPIGATLAKEEVANYFKPGDHGTTLGGNPLATACALTILETIESSDILDNVKARSKQLEAGLRMLQEKHSYIGDVRVYGLLTGVELSIDVNKVIEACYNNHLLVLSAKGNVLRILPSLNVSSEEIEQGLAILDTVFAN